MASNGEVAAPGTHAGGATRARTAPKRPRSQKKAPHGPLQRVLGVGQTKTPRILTYPEPDTDNHRTDAHFYERILHGHSEGTGEERVRLPWLGPPRRNNISLDRSAAEKKRSVKYHRSCDDPRENESPNAYHTDS